MSTAICPLRDAAQTSPREMCLIRGEQATTYAEMDQIVSTTSAILSAMGVRPGHRIALALPDGLEWAVCAAALWRLGAIFCPLPAKISKAGTAIALKALAPAAVILNESKDGDPLYAGQVRILIEKAMAFLAPPGIPRIEAVLQIQRPALLLPLQAGRGAHRWVRHRVAGLYYGARGVNLALRLRSHNRWLLPDGFSSPTGMSVFFQCLLAGAGVVVPTKGLSVGEAIERHRVTHLSLDAKQIEALTQMELETLRRASVIVLEADGLTDAVLGRAVDAQLPIHVAFSIPEAISWVTCAERMTAHRDTGCGSPLRHREFRIEDDGRIAVRGPILPDGDLTEDGTFHPWVDGSWRATETHGRVDDAGNLHLMRKA